MPLTKLGPRRASCARGKSAAGTAQAAAADRRTQRTRAALHQALAAEIHAQGDLSKVTATGIAHAAGVTRRSFYTHYHDVESLVADVECELLDGLVETLSTVSSSTLDDLHDQILALQPASGAVEVLEYVRANGVLFQALMGPGGDPGFVARVEDAARDAVIERAAQGLPLAADSPAVDYYVTSVICAELGVVRRWVAGGMKEDVETMAAALTMFAFVRPGDLYGKPLDFDVPAYGMALVRRYLERNAAAAAAVAPVVPTSIAPTGTAANALAPPPSASPDSDTSASHD